MGQVFAFANMKGGVGKTTSSVLFAEAIAKSGRSVLFVDLDAQASASYAIAGFDGLKAASSARRNLCGFIENCLNEGNFQPLDAYIDRGASRLEDCEKLDLLQSHPDLRLVERSYLRESLKRSRVFTPIESSLHAARRPLFDEIRRVSAAYDAVVVDCPPGVSLFVEAGASAADVIVCPTTLDPLATLGLETFIARFYLSDWLQDELAALGRTRPPLRILFSRVDPSAPGQASERARVEALLRQREWAESGLSLLEEEIEASPALAYAFADPDLTRNFDERYGKFAQRCVSIAQSIEKSAASDLHAA